MARYAAFLRGVNVGGVNLKMAAVAHALEAAGFGNVKTILASGNVLLESRSGVAAVRKKAEQALRDEFGYDAWVLAYEMDAIAAISAAYPFDREEFLCPHGDLPEKRCRGRAGFYQEDVDTRGLSTRLGIDHIRDPRRKHFQFCIFPGSGVSKVRLQE